jgi:ATP-dependent helicase HepA
LLVETLFPNMLAAATEIAEIKAKTEISLGLRRMLFSLDHEIERLKALQTKNNHIRPEEIKIAEAERARLGELIKHARIRLDAVQLIQMGSF